MPRLGRSRPATTHRGQSFAEAAHVYDRPRAILELDRSAGPPLSSDLSLLGSGGLAPCAGHRRSVGADVALGWSVLVPTRAAVGPASLGGGGRQSQIPPRVVSAQVKVWLANRPRWYGSGRSMAIGSPSR